MSENPEVRGKRVIPFKTSTFGGYDRSEVDAYLDEVARAGVRDADEIEVLKRRVTDLEGQIVGNIPVETEIARLEDEVARLRAQLEAVRQDEALRVGQTDVDVQELREQLRKLRDEHERTLIETARLQDETAKFQEEAEAARAERDSFQRLTERLSSDEHQAKEDRKSVV